MSNKQGAATVRIAGAIGVQRGTRMLQAFTDAITIADHQAVDIFNPDSGQG
jgi:hypothetical protein